MMWKPIETAPKGEDIILWNGTERLLGCRFGRYFYDLTKCSECNEDTIVDPHPTHWAPLLSPPVNYDDPEIQDSLRQQMEETPHFGPVRGRMVPEREKD